MTDTWGRRLFVAGAIWLILMGAVHSLSFFEKQVPTNDTERQLLDLMTNYKFNLGGSMRTMNDFLRGFSIAFMVGMIGLGILDFGLRHERLALVKRAALISALWMAVMVAVSLRYFFVIPTSFLAIALILFIAAWLKLPGEAS